MPRGVRELNSSEAVQNGMFGADVHEARAPPQRRARVGDHVAWVRGIPLPGVGCGPMALPEERVSQGSALAAFGYFCAPRGMSFSGR